MRSQVHMISECLKSSEESSRQECIGLSVPFNFHTMSPNRLAHVYDVQESIVSIWDRFCPTWIPPPGVFGDEGQATQPSSSLAPKRGARRPAPYLTSSSSQYVLGVGRSGGEAF